jgi:hypothetical protein
MYAWIKNTESSGSCKASSWKVLTNTLRNKKGETKTGLLRSTDTSVILKILQELWPF